MEISKPLSRNGKIKTHGAWNMNNLQVRQRLIDDRESIQKSEQAKKQRELKKFGKQVQQQVYIQPFAYSGFHVNWHLSICPQYKI